MRQFYAILAVAAAESLFSGLVAYLFQILFDIVVVRISKAQLHRVPFQRWCQPHIHLLVLGVRWWYLGDVDCVQLTHWCADFSHS